MVSIIINIIKIVFLLGFLVFIHEGGHFLAAKFCKIKVNEFAIGFGPAIWKKKGKETTYELRLIPLGGFVNLEGEDPKSLEKISEKSFRKASFSKKVLILLAGPAVNIILGLMLYLTLTTIVYQDFNIAFAETQEFLASTFEGLKMLFTGKVGVNELTGPVGISNMITHTTSIANYINLLSMISVSLGVTNLLPVPALDGGKILILLIEKIRKKPLKEETEIKIQLAGLCVLVGLSIFVTYNDIHKIV